MARETNLWKLAAVGCLALLAGTWMADGPRAAGQQDTGGVRFEYSVVNIDALSLQAKLSELGNDGWELVTVTIAESKVDGGNNPPKVVTEKYDVTCRKVTKK